MYKNSFLRPILIIGLITVIFASCDKDFNELGTDIVGDDHFGFEQYTDATLKAYNQKLGPIASNNLPINPLGFYSNPVFGDTQANFVTQVELSSVNPTFNNTTPGDYSTEAGHGPTVLDSVIMEIPYFINSRKIKTETDNKKTYVLDSIFGETPFDNATPAIVGSKFKLSVYQSNYYLRDLDPGQSLAEQQLFYTDQNSLIDANKIPILLNDAPLADIPAQGIKNADGHENSSFYFDKREHRTTTLDDDGNPVDARSAPSMRLHLNKTIFDNLILNAPSGQLVNNSAFKNYFKGIYFKVDDGNPGNMAMINFKAGKITLYYNEDKKNTSTTIPTYERVNKTFVLNLAGNTISLLNSNDNPNYLNAANSSLEASRLYLKGGEGSMSVIDLFGSADTYRYDIKKVGGIPVDENGDAVPLDVHGDAVTGHYLVYTKTTIANGIPDELDDLRYPAHLTIEEDPGQIYRSVKNRWMINEANLTFNVDQPAMINPKAIEPNRIFLYDLDNKKVLVDYVYDITTDGTYPKRNKLVFGGILLNSNGTITKQIKDDATGRTTQKGYKYKIRITNHVRNLINNDSTNVRLGLSVTENINSVGLSKLRTPNANSTSAPSMSVLNQLGTILYGTNIPFGDPDYGNRLKLEIYYTKPN